MVLGQAAIDNKFRELAQSDIRKAAESLGLVLEDREIEALGDLNWGGFNKGIDTKRLNQIFAEQQQQQQQQAQLQSMKD